MADVLLGQSESHLVASHDTVIPQAPSFAEFKFKTIGQEPQLLKRISASTPDSQYHGRSSPSPALPELEYPSRPVSPKPLSRPSLLQFLTRADSSDVIMLDMPDGMVVGNPSAQQDRSAMQNTPRLVQVPTPEPQLSTSFRTPVASRRDTPNPSQKTDGVIADGSVLRPTSSSSPREQIPTPFSSSQIANTPVRTIVPATIVPATAEFTYEADSSYTDLRNLQARLLSSLSTLNPPPNTTEALLLVQAANSYSANALSTAHQSHALAQQSLASAQEAVSAAKECLGAAEAARAHASDAVAAVEQLGSANLSLEPAGNIGLEWKTTMAQLQDDLRALGEWVSKREGEEALKRREADRLAQEKKHKEDVEAAMSSELARRVPEADAGGVGNNRASLPLPSLAPRLGRNQERQRTAELEANAATRAWSLEHGCPAKYSLTTAMDVAQPATQVQPEEILAPEQRNNDQPRESSREEARLHAQREEEDRIRELHQKKIEVAKFQMQERERIEADDSSKRTAEESRLKRKREAAGSQASRPAVKEIGVIENYRSKSSTSVVDAKRASEAYKEAERASAERQRLQDEESMNAVVAQQREEAKRAETRRLLEQRKQRELEDLEKRQAERDAVEREAEIRERELIAEQGRRRQEVMAQKQRASAETAARINAERAREKEKSKSASSVSPGSIPSHSLPDHQTEYGNLPAKKTITGKTSKKPRSISGGVKLGPTTPDEPDYTSLSSPPSPSLRKAPSITFSTTTTPVTRHPTPTNVQIESESLHVHRRSDDPGNICVIPQSLVPPASPEAQAANLRFVKDSNGVPWDTYLTPSPLLSGDVKKESRPDDGLSASQGVDGISATAIKSKSRPHVDRVKSDAGPKARANPIPTPTLNIPLPNKPYSLPPVHKTKPPKKKKSKVISDQQPIATPMATAPAVSVAVPPLSPPVPASVSATQPIKKLVTVKRPPPSLSTSTRQSSDTSRGNSALPTRTNSKHSPLISPLITRPAAPSSETTVAGSNAGSNEPKQFEEYSQIAPTIPEHIGWDQPSWSMDAEGYGVASRSEEPPRPRLERQVYQRGGDHRSSVPRSPTPTYQSRPSPSWDARAIGSSRQPRASPPVARSPMPPRSPISLGKRRYPEDPRLDEPPAHRHWSPGDDRRREEQSYTSRSAWPPPWRSPSPETPALQARIGARDSDVYAIGNGQSYRPTYAGDTYRPQSRTSDNYRPIADPEYSASYGWDTPTPPGERHRLGRHHVADSRMERMPSSSRGRGSSNATRGGNRGRGGRGGSLPLEKRITSHKPMTLMHRLESPVQKY
ncbi:hypothetical protein FPV67DRAFT_1021625 [Lyophyllum atratum]|nr:hypothetical protein FPV67DRAFT_1021625 [Lyophyllum atratum]